MCNKRKLYTCVFSCHMWGCARMILYTWCNLKTWLLKIWNHLVLYACTCLLQKTQCGISWHHAIFKTWLPQSWNCLQLVFANNRLWTSKAWTRWVVFQDLASQVLKRDNFSTHAPNLTTVPSVTPIQIWQSKAVGMGIVQLKNGALQNPASKCENEVPEKWFRNLPHLPSQVLNPFGAKNFNIRPLPRIMSFMIWPSKTWTQVNMIVKTWQPQVWNLTPFFWRLGMPSFEMLHFCNSMSPSLDNDCTIQDVAFKSSNLSG